MFNRLPALARFLLALIAIDLVVFAAFRGAFASASWNAAQKAPRNAVNTTRSIAISARRNRASAGSRLNIAL